MLPLPKLKDGWQLLRHLCLPDTIYDKIYPSALNFLLFSFQAVLGKCQEDRSIVQGFAQPILPARISCHQ